MPFVFSWCEACGRRYARDVHPNGTPCPDCGDALEKYVYERDHIDPEDLDPGYELGYSAGNDTLHVNVHRGAVCLRWLPFERDKHGWQERPTDIKYKRATGTQNESRLEIELWLSFSAYDIDIDGTETVDELVADAVESIMRASNIREIVAQPICDVVESFLLGEPYLITTCETLVGRARAFREKHWVSAPRERKP